MTLKHYSNVDVCNLKRKTQNLPCDYLIKDSLDLKNNNIKPHLCNHESNTYYYCIEKLVKSPLIRRSMIEDYTMCLRKFYLSWIKGYEHKSERDNYKIYLGNVLGRWLEKIHQDQYKHEFETIKDKLMGYKSSLIGKLILQKNEEEELNFIDLLKLQVYCLLEVYLEDEKFFNPLKGGPFELGVTEKYFEKTIKGDGFNLSLCCHADLYIDSNKFDTIDDSGLYEFKTTVNPDYYNNFNQHWQNSVYLYLSDVTSIKYRLFVRPEYKVNKNESIKDFSERVVKLIKKRLEHFFQEKVFYSSEYLSKNQLINFIESVINIASEMRDRIIKSSIDVDYIDQPWLSHFWQNHKACFNNSDNVNVCQFYKSCSSYDVISMDRYKHKLKHD